MNDKITEYLKNALKDSLYPVIPFKDNNLVSLKYEELLCESYSIDSNIDSNDKISSLLNTNEINKLFGKSGQAE